MDNLQINLRNERDFFGLFDTLLYRGYFTHQKYIENNRKFLFAKIIRENNERIISLILNYCHLLPEKQRSDLMLIVYHIDSWRTQWEDLYEKLKPKIDDEFVFDTLVKFPKESLARLNKYYYSNFNKNFYLIVVTNEVYQTVLMQVANKRPEVLMQS